MSRANSWDDESSDDYGYSDEEFDLDESVAEAPDNDRKDDRHERENTGMAGQSQENTPPVISTTSPQLALTARGRGRQESLLNMNAFDTSSPKMKLTDRGRGRQESLFDVLKSRQGSVLNLPVWNNEDMKERDEDEEEDQDDEEVEVYNEGTGTLVGGPHIPVWDEAEEKKEAMSQQRFNRDLAVLGAHDTVKDNETSEYLSPSTSTAIASMIRETKHRSQENVHRSTQEEDDRVLAWLAAQVESGKGGMRYAENMSDHGSQWYINPKLHEASHVARTASQYKEVEVSVQKRLSELGMPLADQPATPGSVEESVLELMLESLLDELRYPVRREDELEYQKLLQGASENEKAALIALSRQTDDRRAKSERHVYSIPDVRSRPGVERAIESSYLSLVRRACLCRPGTDYELSKSCGIGEDLATRVQKELIGVITDMFTDPSIVSTIKTATLSRVFEGTSLLSKKLQHQHIQQSGSQGMFSP